MSFFIKGKQLNESKRAKFSKDKPRKKKTAKQTKTEEITSSESDDNDESLTKNQEDYFEDEHETAQEKKIRLAKVYLQEIEKEQQVRLENEEIDDSIISKRLKEDYLKESGRLRLTVAEQFKAVDEDNIKILKCREQRKSITCFCISFDNQHLYVGSKDGCIVKYCLLTYKKIGLIRNTSENDKKHGKQVFSIAISSDNKFLVIGNESKDIFVWDPVNLRIIKKLTGHKNAVTGLCFKRDSPTLYSCSKDRTAKVWNLDDMAYVETLFGHQDAIASIDTLYKDHVVTSGGHDLRIWKIPEETQLIFNGHIGNIDNVRMINEEYFISGGDDGQICIWSIMRKRPLCIIHEAHGKDTTNQQPYWISAVTALINTDLVASGSQDGFIKLWKLENNFKSISFLMKIPVEGFINSLNFTSDGTKLIAAVSREHKCGRWDVMTPIKNHIVIFPFVKSK